MIESAGKEESLLAYFTRVLRLGLIILSLFAVFYNITLDQWSQATFFLVTLMFFLRLDFFFA